MKKLFLMVAAVLATVCATAQTQPGNATSGVDDDFFLGKWEMTIHNGPTSEDIVSVVTIWRVDGALEATYGENKCSQVELQNAGTLTMFFESQGYGVNVVIEKVTEDTVKGVAADMFDLTGKRMVE